MLSTETDLLEESNNEIKSQIDRIIQRGKMTDDEIENVKKQIETECADLVDQINKA